MKRIAILAILLPGAAFAQLGLPPIGGVLQGVERTLPRVGDLPVVNAARGLVRARVDRLQDLVARFPRDLELDPQGNPAVRGELLLTGASDTRIAAAEAAGFRVLERGTVEGADVPFVRLAVPDGQSLGSALKRLRKIAPEAEASANALHFESGIAAGGGTALAQGGGGSGQPIGMIDGGVAAAAGVSMAEQRGFAAGAPAPSGHGTAVASLIAGTGRVRGAAPDAPLVVADIYGRDPKGGNALALAKALGWMAEKGVRAVTVSLVGPANPLVAATVRAVQGKGVTIVAAVGNDGPAAPPAYPASYPGVIAVTAVDGRNRPLIEAGRALHLDFAAPGADMLAASADGGARPVRGTSFAAPLVAGRLARTGSVAALVREARDLGPHGPDKSYGRGLVCGDCRTPVR
ncbi:peptidase S8 family protein [Sphingomonas changbaiensis NBRC 104936]|uniref:Peptidase S8 family protein n=1 Tax=Sphingomonas changbaiensis NBRC 104936 TaxID=1219043 RepID=A0A0E9MSX0_9SPHN|nr:S8 family serine peptidase [Sphingomonas changbaiensis]GAO40674.1 peptidase S8 family protein [Sphingomonas changbaiensis NBRC 104936]